MSDLTPTNTDDLNEGQPATTDDLEQDLILGDEDRIADVDLAEKGLNQGQDGDDVEVVSFEDEEA